MSRKINLLEIKLVFFCVLFKNVDIQLNVHDVFLEKPSYGTLYIEILESQII